MASGPVRSSAAAPAVHPRAAGAAAAIAIGLLGCALAVHAIEVVPSTDDFCNRLAASGQPLGAAMLDAYRGWTGRILTTGLLYATLPAFDPFALQPVALALAALLVVAAWLVASIATIALARVRAAVTTCALAALLIGLYGVVGQTLFWTTGGIVYMVPLVLLLAWLASMRRLFVAGDGGAGAAAGFAFGVLVGNAIELVVPIALAYGITMLAAGWRSHPPRLRRIAAWRLAGIATGAAALMLAPGNFTRAGATATVFDGDADVIAAQLRQALGFAADASWPMAAVVAVIIACTAAVATRLAEPRRAASLRVEAKEAASLIVGALLGLAPVLLVPAQFTPRNLLFALAMLLLAALLVAVPVLARSPRAPLATSLLALALALPTAALYLQNAGEARAVRGKLVEQDRALRAAAASGAREAVVPPIGVPPRTVHFIELATDPERWDNRCIARHYGLQRVRRSEGPR